MGEIIIAGKKINYKPYVDDMYLERLKARLSTDCTFIRVFQKNLTDQFFSHLRNIVDPTIKHEQNFIISLSGQTGTGKSMAVISLAKLIYSLKFSYKNVCFFDSKILELAPTLPRDSIIIRDENPAKAVYGAGSQRIEMDLVVLSETVRKFGLSLIFVEPTERQMDIVKWYLETVDIDYDNRITRLAVKDPHTKTFLGAIYVRAVEATDVDWIEYNKIKDAFIEDVKKGNYSGAKADYTSLARKVASKIDTNIFSKKQDRLVYVQSMFPTFTNQEVRIIHTFVEIIIKGGDAALPEANNTK
jgi:hypothetical protein